MTYELPPYLKRAVYGYAKSQFPKEACGLVVEDSDGTHRFVSCANIHDEPENHFRIRPSELEEATRFARLVAIVHSHTKGQATPSRNDMLGQIASGVPWVIVVMREGQIIEDFAFPVDLDEPMKGLPYRHGVRDCYTCIQKYYWQELGVRLPVAPRDEDWWAPEDGHEQPDLYMTNFAPAGFRRLEPHEVLSNPENPRSPMLLQPGDVGLGRVNSRVLNHGVVYTGGQLMYHHLFSRIGAEEPVTRWLSRIEVWLRLTDEALHEYHSSVRPYGGDVPQAPEA